MTRRLPLIPPIAHWTAWLLACMIFGLMGPAQAQVTLRPDGQWRHLVGVGASVASGNTRTTSLNLSLDSVRATYEDKWSLTGSALKSRTEGDTTAQRAEVKTQYDRDISLLWFGFGSAAGLHDRAANIDSRLSLATGLGYHLLRTEGSYWDVSAGVGYSRDRYVDPTVIDGRSRSSRDRLELVLAEESTTYLSDTARFKQQARLLPSLRESGEFRAELIASLAVAINAKLSLTASLTYRHDTQPGEGFSTSDTLFVTGISLGLD
jgi:putative salt-induced outer membrane protein